MKVLVCGGRDYTDRETLYAALDELEKSRGPIVEVIHGAARGADTLAGEWAEARGKVVRAFPADWKRYGRSAGPRRNKQMLDEGRPDLVVSFLGGTGTLNMRKQATAAGVEVIEALAVIT